MSWEVKERYVLAARSLGRWETAQLLDMLVEHLGLQIVREKGPEESGSHGRVDRPERLVLERKS